MAKYTIISLILTDFVPISFIFNLFLKQLGNSGSKKSQVEGGEVGNGGVNPFLKSPKLKKGLSPLGMGGQDRFGPSPKFGKLPLCLSVCV